LTAATRLTTIEKANRILGLFSVDDPLLRPSEIAARLGVPRSTVHKYVHSLVQTGFLTRHMGGPFLRLGPRLLELAAVSHRSTDLVDVAYPVLHRLARETGETALLTELIGAESVCLARAESSQHLKVTYEVGQSYPLHAGASSLVLLAGVPKTTQRRIIAGLVLKRYTENTITSRSDLCERLEEIRERGFAVSRGEFLKHVFAVAAPIELNAPGLVASASIAGPLQRLTKVVAREMVKKVKKSALEVSQGIRGLQR